MKVYGLLLAIVFVAGAFTTAQAATDATRTICHRTSLAKTPYVKLRLSGAKLAAHLKHGADIVPVPSGGCPRSL